MHFQSNARQIRPQIPLAVMGFVCLSPKQCFENLPLRVQFQSFCLQNTWKAYTHLELHYRLWLWLFFKLQDLASNSPKHHHKTGLKRAGTIVVTTCIIISFLSTLLTATRTNSGFILFFFCISPLQSSLQKCFDSVPLPECNFCHKNDNRTASCIQNLKSHDKGCVRET